MPLTGWFSANVGRKRALLLAIGLFTAASLLCALSGTLADWLRCAPSRVWAAV